MAKIKEEGDSIALVLFSGMYIAYRYVLFFILIGVQFFTGQFFDVAAITEAGHSKVRKRNKAYCK